MRFLSRFLILALIAAVCGCGGSGPQGSEPTIDLVVVGQAGSTLGLYSTNSKGEYANLLKSFPDTTLFVAGLTRATDGTIGCWYWNGMTGASTGLVLQTDGTIAEFNLPIMPEQFTISPDGTSYALVTQDSTGERVYTAPLNSSAPTRVEGIWMIAPWLNWVPGLGLVFDQYVTGNTYKTVAAQPSNASNQTVLTVNRVSGRGFSADGKTWMFAALQSDGSYNMILAPSGQQGHTTRHFAYRSGDVQSIALDSTKRLAFFTTDELGQQLQKMDLNTDQVHSFTLPGVDKVFEVVEK